MEKSIESIWKEGFVDDNALVAPKLNNLYHQKSKHIIDKFIRMFRINLIAIVVGSIVIIIASIVVKIPYMGIMMFFVLNGLVIINKKLFNSLESIDKNQSSYHYLKSFNGWMQEQLRINKRIARYMYPLVLLSIVFGFWFGSFGGDVPGEIMIEQLLIEFPDMHLILGIPLLGIIALLLILPLLYLAGGKIYQLDVNIVYGRVLKKLNEIIVDIEELRGETIGNDVMIK